MQPWVQLIADQKDQQTWSSFTSERQDGREKVEESGITWTVRPHFDMEHKVAEDGDCQEDNSKSHDVTIKIWFYFWHSNKVSTKRKHCKDGT